MGVNLIRFDIEAGRGKPENIVHTENDCPFCHPEGLTDIIATEEGGIILLRNKYNVLMDAEQFVLVEAERCGNDMQDYTRKHMRRLIRFGVSHWNRMEADPRYRAVIFFKNHGRYSGGTMRHPHMQLVGFRTIDPTLFPGEGDFVGYTILDEGGVVMNAATRPRVGFGELNIVAEPDALDRVADLIQKGVAYICDNFPRSEDSYNIFFYRLGERIGIKLMPRVPTSPLLIGYDLRILPSNSAEIARDFQERYL